MLNATLPGIKDILLQTHPDTLKSITEGPLSVLLDDSSHLPDIETDYPCVYMGGFAQKNRRNGLTYRDIIRLGNVLVDSTQLSNAIQPYGMGEMTAAAAREVGEVWRRGVEESIPWIHLHEFGIEDVVTVDQPPELDAACFDEAYPYQPYYVGYSLEPLRRIKVHRSSPPIPSDLVARDLHSLNHVINVLVEKLNGVDLKFHAVLLWTSWHGSHYQGQVFFT
jgi:hypothetical protein